MHSNLPAAAALCLRRVERHSLWDSGVESANSRRAGCSSYEIICLNHSLRQQKRHAPVVRLLWLRSATRSCIHSPWHGALLVALSAMAAKVQLNCKNTRYGGEGRSAWALLNQSALCLLWPRASQ